uniref:EF-hand domain-containing protein n=1 Tax=Timema douglasi TaxID=61478 RepID=A0A7R8VHK7_TIMDO|nr:unnamed protein product [Timema douglasi]
MLVLNGPYDDGEIGKSRSFIEDQLLRNRKTFVYVLQENCEVKVRYPHPFSELGHSSNARMRESAVQNTVSVSQTSVATPPPPVAMRASYSEDQLAEFQEAFQLFDSRGDGKIHVTQIGDVLRALGQNPTESDVKKFTHQHKPEKRHRLIE